MPRYNNRASFERLVNARTSSLPGNKKLVVTAYKSNVQGWRVIGGKRYYFRSLWEIQYACYLEWLKCKGQINDWFYEPKLFEFPKEAYRSGPFFYKPDFKVIANDLKHSWHEIKGYMTQMAKKKHKRFEKHYPTEMLYIIGGAEMKQIAQYRALIPNWEYFIPQ